MEIRFENLWTNIDGITVSAQAKRYDITVIPKSHIVYDSKYIEASVVKLMGKFTPDKKIHFVDETNVLVSGDNVHYASDKFSINLHSSLVWRPAYPHVTLEDRIKGLLRRRFSLDTEVTIKITDLYSDNVMFYGDRRGDAGNEASYFRPNLLRFAYFKNHVEVSNTVIDEQIRELYGRIFLPKSEVNYHDKQLMVCLRKIDGDDLTFGFDHDYDPVVVFPEGGTHPQAIVSYVATHLSRFHHLVDNIIMFQNGIEYRSKVVPRL